MSAPPGPPPFTPRTAMALGGILLGALMSGINNRVGALGLADIAGQLGAGQDAASWLSTWYTAGELVVMPFAGWFAITMGLRRFHQYALTLCCLIAVALPFSQSLGLMMVLRFVQGAAAGCLIPVLMMAALKFLPPAIRLHGLALYSMTATVAPNVAVQLTGFWSDGIGDWRWLYWQIVPAGIIAGSLVRAGLPDDPILLPRFRQGNWFGALAAVPGLVLVIIALTQGDRLEWFESGLIRWSAACGAGLVLLYLGSEWRHPTPFLKLQLLGRRNLAIGFSLFLGVLVVMLSSSMLPAAALGALHRFRALQVAPLGLVVALPQLVVAPAVALLLYRHWVDARKVFALGLCCMAGACFIGAGLTSDWMAAQFLAAQGLQMLGQPMAVVSLLFLATSVVAPPEGPYVAGTVNTIRAIGTTLGSALVERLLEWREAFHAGHLEDYLGRMPHPAQAPLASLQAAIAEQAGVLAIADAQRVLGCLALLMVPFCLMMTRIPAPVIPRTPTPPVAAPAAA